MDKTIIALSDGSTTYNLDVEVIHINDVGQRELRRRGLLGDEHIVAKVTLADLLDFWNKAHGTKF